VSLDTPQTNKISSAPETVLKFVHTADLHLDSPLKSLALRDPALAELVDNATRTTLVRIVDFCLAQEVDALLIAGDLYDGEQHSMHTAAVLTNQMRKLHDANIPVFIIRGNHDAKSTITKRLLLPENVKVLSGHTKSIVLESKNTVIHGVSFTTRHVPESLLPKYNAPVANKINIGLLHTSLGGSAAHDEYAPCSIKDLEEFGYDYWALGHIHKRSVYQSNTTIVMPGIPQGRDIGEDGSKSISYVKINTDKDISVEEHSLNPVQFERLTLDLSSLSDWQAMLDKIELCIRTCRRNCNTDQVLIRIELTGSTELNHRIHHDRVLLEELIKEFCSSTGEIWFDSLKIRTNANAAEHSISVLPELHTILETDVLHSAELHEQALHDVQQLTGKLPPELKHLFGTTEEERKDRIKKLLKEGSETLLGQLSLND